MLWNRWKSTGEEEDYDKYKKVNRRVKEGARQAKQRSFDQFVAELDTMRAQSAVSRMSRLIKTRRRRLLQQTQATQRIEPSEFTHFVATQHSCRIGERKLARSHFQVDEEWRAELEWALKVAPSGKATGVDEVFGEALQACEEGVIIDWMLAVWESCGEYGILPKAWRQSMLFPLLKKEPANNPRNWRAVALLSHCRKLIEKVIDGKIRREYRFHNAQCGFRQSGSVETAILRLIRAIAQGCKYV